MKQSLIILSTLLATAFICVTKSTAAPPPTNLPLAGQWQPIADLKGKTVTEVAESAVNDYNSKLPKTESPLKLVRVVDGDEKSFSDGKLVYRLHLDALTRDSVVAKDKAAQLYEVVVGVADGKAGEKIKQLLAFLPVIN
ncbi:hypothetical protein LINGRAHAP2_LOCUS26239 [Linum grandiflorum]